MLAQAYWQLAKETGWTYQEIDAVLLSDFDEIVEQWTGAAPERESVSDVQASPVRDRLYSIEELDRIAAAERGFAVQHGGKANPWR